jgi:hypothetical protein
VQRTWRIWCGGPRDAFGGPDAARLRALVGCGRSIPPLCRFYPPSPALLQRFRERLGGRATRPGCALPACLPEKNPAIGNSYVPDCLLL